MAIRRLLVLLLITASAMSATAGTAPRHHVPARNSAATPSAAAATAPSADSVVAAACKEAAATHRKVFLIFHASWCGWCHRMDSIMGAPVCKPLFDANYVITHLVIMETGPKQVLINPGAQDLYNKYAGGNNQGIPFFLIIGADGRVIQDSRIKPQGAAPGSQGNNTGCPEEVAELDYFVQVLKETSGLTADQVATIRAQFTRKKA